MAFRFRFPWGSLLAALGYASLAAAFAYPLLDDFHGLLWLRALLDAAAAALLGVIAWRYGERLTDHVNLHTSALLRLGLGGAGGIWLATQWTGVFSEFAAGVPGWWWHVAASLLFLAVALPPALALVTLLTWLETALAARRGGGGVADALRPLLRYAALSVLVLAGVGYVLAMIPQAPTRLALAIAPDLPRASGWIEREQRLFAQVARGWNCDVLVVPPDAPAPSVDRPARSLITRYLSAELSRRGTLCVADPTLVARALGTTARAYDARRVQSLADAIGARALVRSQVRMDSQRPAYTLVLQVSRRAAPKAAWSAVEETQWGPIVFSDDVPPEVAFSRIAREAADGLGLELEAMPAEQGGTPVAERSELNLAGLVSTSDDPVRNARALQLLAAAHHASEVAGEHLWERSLIALAAGPRDDAQVRALSARAALHLHRRPYALALLDVLETPEAQALRALADGNLGAAARAGSGMTDAYARVTLDLELEALRGEYGRAAGAAERRKQVLDSYPGLAALLFVPFSADLPQQWEPILAAQLEQLEGAAPSAALAGAMLPLSQWLAQAAGIHSAAGDIESGYASTWRARASGWRLQQAYDRVAEWDAFDALHASNRAAVLLQARGPGDAAASAARIRWLGDAFAGHPGLQGTLAPALARVPDEFPGTGLNAERARRLARDVTAWEAGETEIDRLLRVRLAVALPPDAADEPPRAWRALARRPDAKDATPADAGELPEAARLERYAQHEFDVLRRAIELHEHAGDTRRASLLAHEASVRFRGSPVREAFLLAHAQARRDLAAIAQAWRERVEDDPAEWAHYRALALTQLRAGDAADAQRTMLAFAPMTQGPPSASLAAAASGAEMLVGAGEVQLARPLLLVAARPGAEVSGGVAQLRARAVLAQLDGDWPTVRELAVLLHEQHQEPRALAQAAQVSFLLGRPEEGWRSFYEASKRFEQSAPWEAAAAGHRLEGTKPDEVIAFAKRWKSLSGSAAVETRLRGRFLFDMLLVDRPGSDSGVEAMTQFAGEKDPALAAHAKGYVAFKRERHEEAIQHLLPMQQAGSADPAALPWLVHALIRAGRMPEATALLPAASTREPGFHALLAQAYVSGSAGSVDQALDRLWDAFLAMPSSSETNPLVPPGYQLLETCERLHALTGEPRYRDLLVDLARRQQRAWPHSWAYAYEARYATHPEDRERALGMALFLDAESEHLRPFTPDQRQRAAERFAGSAPFRRG